MEKILLQNQILIMESNLKIMESQNNFNVDFKKQLKEQIMFSKTYLKNLA
jgi:hypothetical protein